MVHVLHRSEAFRREFGDVPCDIPDSFARGLKDPDL
jgi:hypothetical protein